MLELFYSDPRRWAYTFQSYAFLRSVPVSLCFYVRPCLLWRKR